MNGLAVDSRRMLNYRLSHLPGTPGHQAVQGLACYRQGSHCTGKTQGIWKFWNLEFGKTQGIWFAQVVNSLILKVKDILIFAANFFFFKLDKSAKSVLCMK